MKFIKKLILSLFFLLLLAACAVGGHFVWQGYQIYQQVIQETPLADKVEEIRSKPHYTTISQLPEIYKMRWWQWRTNVFTDMGESISSLREGRLSRISGKKAGGGRKLHHPAACQESLFSQERNSCGRWRSCSLPSTWRKLQ